MATQHKTLAAALIAAQRAFTPVVPDQTVRQKGKTRDGRDYEISYQYADLAQVIAATNPALHENGLVVVQGVDQVNGAPMIHTMLLHDTTGDKIENWTPVIWAERDNMQKYGGAITYTRRYALKAMLNIADEDDDGQHATAPAPPKRETVNQTTGEVRHAAPVPDVKEREQKGTHTPEQNSLMWGLARGSLRMSREDVHQELFGLYKDTYGWGSVEEVSVTHLSYKDMSSYIDLLQSQVRLQGIKR